MSTSSSSLAAVLRNHAIWDMPSTGKRLRLESLMTSSLLAVHGGVVYVYVGKGIVRVLSLHELKKAIRDNEASSLSYSELSSTSSATSSSPSSSYPPDFAVDAITMEPTGRHLALVGYGCGGEVVDHDEGDTELAGIYVLPLMRSAGESRMGEPIRVGEDIFALNPGLRIIQARWHPLSAGGCHLVVLTSDNVLRIFNVLKPRREESAVHVTVSHGVEAPESRILSARSINLVSFDFASGLNVPSDNGESSHMNVDDIPVNGGRHWIPGWELFTVYFLADTGDIYCACPVVPLSCILPIDSIHALVNAEPTPMSPFGSRRRFLQLAWLQELLLSRQDHNSCPDHLALFTVPETFSRNYACRTVAQGPLPIKPQVDDNIMGGCQLLCLSGPSPLVLVVAREEGLVNICIALDVPEALWDNNSGRNAEHEDIRKLPTISVYEQIDLQLPFGGGDEFDDCSDAYRFCLLPDSLFQGRRFFVYHVAGVHRVDLQWLDDLRRIFMYPAIAEAEADSTVSSLPPSIVQGLLQTMPLPASPFAPVLGAVVIHSPLVGYSLLALTCDHQGVLINLSLPDLIRPPAPIPDLDASMSSMTVSSTVNGEAFKAEVVRAFAKCPPLTRLEGQEMSYDADCVRFLNETATSLRDTYLLTMTRLKTGIIKRTQLLTQRQVELDEESSTLRLKCDEITSRGKELGIKYMRAAKNFETFDKRASICLDILGGVQDRLSDGERAYFDELNTIRTVLPDLKRINKELLAKFAAFSRNLENRHNRRHGDGRKRIFSASYLASIRPVLSSSMNTCKTNEATARRLKELIARLQ